MTSFGWWDRERKIAITNLTSEDLMKRIRKLNENRGLLGYDAVYFCGRDANLSEVPAVSIFATPKTSTLKHHRRESLKTRITRVTGCKLLQLTATFPRFPSGPCIYSTDHCLLFHHSTDRAMKLKEADLWSLGMRHATQQLCHIVIQTFSCHFRQHSIGFTC
jgi:hypothetical protein